MGISPKCILRQTSNGTYDFIAQYPDGLEVVAGKNFTPDQIKWFKKSVPRVKAKPQKERGVTK